MIFGEERYSTDGPQCPYCGHTQTPDENYYYDESTTELECGDCCRAYAVSIYISTSWTTTALAAAAEGRDGTARGEARQSDGEAVTPDLGSSSQSLSNGDDNG